MFCYICKKNFETIEKIIFHLKYQEFVKEKTIHKIHCVYDPNCSFSFDTFFKLRSHINKHHNNANNRSTENPCTLSFNNNQVSNNNQLFSNTNNSSYNYNNLEQFSFESSHNLASILDLKDIHNNFYSNLNQSGLPEQIITSIFSETKKITGCVINILSQNNFQNTQRISEIQKEFCSSFKRQKIFISNPFYVKPEEISVGFRWEKRFNTRTLSYNNKSVPNIFQFIPITKTLKSIFSNLDFFKLFLDFNNSHICKKDTYRYACCGNRFQSFKDFFQNKQKILIQLYYDDFEVARVLGSKTIIHKVGAIYFSIINCPDFLKSNLHNIFLVSLFYVNDLVNEFNINAVLKPIVDDVKVMEESGIEIKDQSILYGTIINLSHDNLAANDLIGFTKSFSATFFCRFCSMPHDQTKISSRENSHLIRSENCYLILDEQPPLKKLKMTETQGISRCSILNELKFFNTTKNYSVDLLHDGLEGFVALTLKYQFQFFIAEKVFENIDQLNDCISFYNFGFIDAKNKPSNINLEKNNLGQNAIQILCLASHFSLIFDRFFKTDHQKQWDGVLSAIKLLQLLMRHEFSEDDVIYLEQAIFNYLELMKNVFKKTFTPKQHFLVHYPRVIREMGPVMYMWTMRYESKHRYFKKLLKQNFKNICKTFATRHQQMICTFWSKSNLNKFIIKGKKSLSSFKDECLDSLPKPLYKLSYCSQYFHYKKSFFILKEKPQNYEIIYFLQILEVLDSKDEIYFLVKEFIGVYDEFYKSYQLIDNNSSTNIINFMSIALKKSYESHKCFKNENSYVLGTNIQIF